MLDMIRSLQLLVCSSADLWATNKISSRSLKCGLPEGRQVPTSLVADKLVSLVEADLLEMIDFRMSHDPSRYLSQPRFFFSSCSWPDSVLFLFLPTSFSLCSLFGYSPIQFSQRR